MENSQLTDNRIVLKQKLFSRIIHFDDFLFDTPRLTNDADFDSDDFLNDDEDSNDENNFRNEYPDEEDDVADHHRSSGSASRWDDSLLDCFENFNMGKFTMWLDIINNPKNILENASNPLLKNKFFYRL